MEKGGSSLVLTIKSRYISVQKANLFFHVFFAKQISSQTCTCVFQQKMSTPLEDRFQQSGPLIVINGVKTPIDGLITK